MRIGQWFDAHAAQRVSPPAINLAVKGYANMELKKLIPRTFRVVEGTW